MGNDIGYKISANVKLSHSIVLIIFDYCFDSLPLYRVNQIKDLEFLYVPSLDFRLYIDYISCKVESVLGYIKSHSTN